MIDNAASRKILKSDYYGFNIPNRECWSARVNKYVDIAEMPIDVCRLIAEYGSTFFLTMTEHCPGCDICDRGSHGPFDVAGGLDAIIIPKSSLKTVKNFSFMCDATYTAINLNCNRISYGVDLLTNGTWHRRISNPIHIKYTGCQSLSNPFDNALLCPQCIPRNAYKIVNRRGDEINHHSECTDPYIVQLHWGFPMIGHLWFRYDIF